MKMSTFAPLRFTTFPPPTADLSRPFNDGCALKSGLGQLVRTKQVVHIEDLRTGEAYAEGNPAVVAMADLAGARTLLMSEEFLNHMNHL